MSGNAMFLICEPCSKANEADFGFKLAGRNLLGAYQPFGPAQATRQFTAWLRKHAKCGGKGNPDHFKLGMSAERNYDQPQPKAIEVVTRLPRIN